MRVPPFPLRLRVAEDHAVMPARESGDRVHMRVGHHLRSRAGVELPTDGGELLARVEVEVKLAVTEEVVHWVGCSCWMRDKTMH